MAIRRPSTVLQRESQSFDRRVTRTKSRPLASGELTRPQAFVLLALLLAAAGLLLVFLNPLTRWLAPIAFLSGIAALWASVLNARGRFAAAAAAETMTIPVQVNGKLRGKIEIAADTARDAVERAARDTVAEWLQGSEPKKVIYVEKKLVNFVI